MTILYINGAEAAQTLSAATHEVMAEFNPSKPPKDISSITLLAHTSDDATKIGGRTPEELANEFAAMIPAKKRNTVKHIYLLANEAGMSKHGQPSLAQRFVNKMDDLGFTHLNVHAAVSPGVPGFGMGVEVVTDRNSIDRRPPGFVNAFYYENEESKSIDAAIQRLIETSEGNQKKLAAIPSVSLARESKREKTRLENALRIERVQCQAAISNRKMNRNYKRVYILSTADYKTVMNENCNTFQAYEAEPVMSAPVSYAIYYLSLQTKYEATVKNALDELSSHPEWDIEQVKALLNQHAGDKKGEGSRFYRSVAQPLLGELEKRNFDLLQMADPYEVEKQVASPLQEQGFFAARPAPVEEIPSARTQLENYKTRRTGEWGDFHYNFLGLMAWLYFISDCCFGTDYYNSKRCEIKISAVDKLLQGKQSSDTDFTVHEWRALHEGRLGKIIKDLGGFEDVVAELNPKPNTGDLAIGEEDAGLKLGALELDDRERFNAHDDLDDLDAALASLQC